MEFNRWNYENLDAGVVGSVGDVNMRTRLRQSAPDMPMRWLPDPRGPRLGSNVQDGYPPNYLGNHGAVLVEKRFRPTPTGYQSFGEIIPPAKSVTTCDIPLGSYDWENKIATAMNVKRTGSSFLPLPGAYALPEGALPRGGLTPRVTPIGPTDDIFPEATPPRPVEGSDRYIRTPYGYSLRGQNGPPGTRRG